jgi:hypothetical protein
MMHGADPVRPDHWLALGVGDRDEIHLRKFSKESLEFRDVEPAVECGHGWKTLPTCDREVQIVDVKVNDVKFGAVLSNDFEHSYVVCKRVGYIRSLETLGVLAYGTQFGCGHRVAARVESDIVPLSDELFCEIRYDALRPAVELWRYAFV